MRTCIDLFCGCGGLSKGFQLAGYNVVLGVDFDDAALKTYGRNITGAVPMKIDLFHNENISEITDMLKKKGVESLDVLVMGPPCQGFSLTGPRHFDDPRNQLYLAGIETVRRTKPKAVIVENVPGMATMYDGQIKDEILRRFTEMGYNIICKILTAADYGVPQMRKRLIFMGVRQDIGMPFFPAPYLNPEHYITCRQAIDDLPSRDNELGEEEDVYDKPPRTEYQKLMRGTETVLHNHVATAHKQFVKDTIAQVPEGGNWKDLPTGVGESRKFHEAWTRYDGNKPSKTIDTGHRNHFHYEYNRVPTIRENARLQSFPDNFVFLGTRTQQNRQVGNAVPPLLGKALADQLTAILDAAEGRT